MEIRKLDRNSIQERPEEEIPPISYVDEKDEEGETKEFHLGRDVQEPLKTVPPSQAEKVKPKKFRPVILLSAVVVLVAAGMFYNLTANKGASSIGDDWINLDSRSKQADFYALCHDIEGYKLAHGEYPASIEDINYSDHITYRLTSSQAFQLEYTDGTIDLQYDSGRDKNRLR